MIQIRRSADRGHADHGWLVSRHSFSFADYVDPAHMGFGNLRVINEDRIAPGTGFGTHGHRDMEILSWVLEGELAHRDNMGNGTVIQPGELQRMSAGSGVMHSEFNNDKTGTTHFLQIWILPNVHGITPGYEQKRFDRTEQKGRLQLVGSSDGRDGSVTIHADAALRVGRLDGDEAIEWVLDPQRLTYVYVARGAATVNALPLEAGDAAALSSEAVLRLTQGNKAELLVFDLKR
jgi:redox-sensitive bicupin YhaK (pirin superfamily)